MLMHFLLQINWIKIILFVGSEDRRKKNKMWRHKHIRRFVHFSFTFVTNKLAKK